MPDLATTVLSASLVPYVIAVVMPNWRWLVGITCIVAVVFYAGWPPHWIALVLPNANEGPGGGIAGLLTFAANRGFVTGVIVRGLTLLLESRGLRRRFVVMICVAGAAVAPFAPWFFTFPNFRH